MAKRALIAGVTGQDGAYSAEFLMHKGSEVKTLLGDASRAREKLGWSPRTSFDELVAEMMRADLETTRRDRMVKQAGYHRTYGYHERGGSPGRPGICGRPPFSAEK